MKKESIQLLMRTTMLIAIALAFQSLRLVLPDPTGIAVTYLISTLLNLTLVVACGVSGVRSGLAVAMITPIVAFAQGHVQAPMIPGVLSGNCVLVLSVYPLLKTKNIVGIVCTASGVLIKYCLIALNMSFVFMGTQGMGFIPAASVAFVQQIVQPITATLGVVIALPVLHTLKKALKI